MSCPPYPVSPHTVQLPYRHFRLMAMLVRTLHKLAHNPAYHSLLAGQLPATARFNPGHYSVLMGYDFHLGADGPQLVEVNTNAGGCWLASLAATAGTEFTGRLAERLLAAFLSEYALFGNDARARPTTLAIVDDNPAGQFLYPEMQAFARLFTKAGIRAPIADVGELAATGDGLRLDGQPVPMIYNRHCDFYLETPALAAVRHAFMAGQVCLSPNPRQYGLLADKRRMVIWSDGDQLQALGLGADERNLLLRLIPNTHLLAALPPGHAWRTRKQWVFKPATGYASRGVYAGHKLTAATLAALDGQQTLVQSWVPPTLSQFADGPPFKTDFRVFAYRDRILGVSARLYQGQVTNLRTPSGGFARVLLTAS